MIWYILIATTHTAAPPSSLLNSRTGLELPTGPSLVGKGGWGDLNPPPPPPSSSLEIWVVIKENRKRNWQFIIVSPPPNQNHNVGCVTIHSFLLANSCCLAPAMLLAMQGLRKKNHYFDFIQISFFPFLFCDIFFLENNCLFFDNCIRIKTEKNNAIQFMARMQGVQVH